MGIAILTISSCIYTFHPLHSDDTLIDMPLLEGSFQLDNSNEDDPEIWTFTRTGKGAYDLAIVAGPKQGVMEVHVVKLGGEYFLDILPTEMNSDLIPDFVEWNLMPVYTIARMITEGENVKLLFFDAVWLEEKLSSHKIRIAHEVRLKDEKKPRDIEFILLTAGTGELQKFVEKYARFEDAYDEEGTLLTRVAAR